VAIRVEIVQIAQFPDIQTRPLNSKLVAKSGTIAIIGDVHPIYGLVKISEIARSKAKRHSIEIHWMIAMGCHLLDMVRGKIINASIGLLDRSGFLSETISREILASCTSNNVGSCALSGLN
jgi:hypothetical protein